MSTAARYGAVAVASVAGLIFAMPLLLFCAWRPQIADRWIRLWLPPYLLFAAFTEELGVSSPLEVAAPALAS